MSPAPPPGAVLWGNLHISKTQHIVRGLVAIVLEAISLWGAMREIRKRKDHF